MCSLYSLLHNNRAVKHPHKRTRDLSLIGKSITGRDVCIFHARPTNRQGIVWISWTGVEGGRASFPINWNGKLDNYVAESADEGGGGGGSGSRHTLVGLKSSSGEDGEGWSGLSGLIWNTINDKGNLTELHVIKIKRSRREAETEIQTLRRRSIHRKLENWEYSKR